MSCGDKVDGHGEDAAHRDCVEALDHIDEFVDGEIPADQYAHIASHLAACPPCMRSFALEQLMKVLVARSCTEPAPPHLRARVVAQLMGVRVQVSGR